MAANLHAIKPVLDADKQAAIDTLEEALAEAKDGRIQAVAIAAVRPGFAINTAWSTNNCIAPMLGAVLLLQNRLARALDDEP